MGCEKIDTLSNSPETFEPRNDPRISRRELLKALAALGGAVAASSLLPEKWSQPQVGIGVLPAHAQSSLCIPPYSIDRCTIALPTNEILTTSAWITPACPGVQMALGIVIRINVEAQPESETQTVQGLYTDSAGKATFTMSVPLPGAPKSIYAVWSFFDPGDGSGFCTTPQIDIGSAR
jgi:hypothetical protein